jgi:8-oxo-dGTP pyrophosphatase MutT (NUDIX family)
VAESGRLDGRVPDPELPWQVLESRTLIESPWLRVHGQRLRTASGFEIPEYYLLDAPDIVVVLALTEAGQVVLVRQYRPGAGRGVLELPAGMLDPADQSPAAAAERELLEETGYRPRRLEPLAALYPSPARQSNRSHCFLAIGCQEIALPAGDPAEDNLAVSLLALDDLRALARAGGLPSQSSLACLFLGLERLRDLNLP